MTKKILLGLFILLMCAVSFIAYNFYKNVKEPVSQIAFEAVPQSAALIVKESNFNALFQKIQSTNIIWQELSDSTETVKNIHEQLNYFDSLLTNSFKTSITNQAILASLHLSGANHYDFIFYLSVPESFTEDELLQKLKAAGKSNPTTRDYDGVNIHTFPAKTGKISLTLYKNTLAFSYSAILIEDVIRQLNNESSLLNDKDFAKVMEASGQAEDGNVFINNTHFTKIINQYLNKASKEYFQSFENYATWTELDMDIKPNSFAMSGFSFARDKNSIHQLKDQKAVDLDALAIIPYNAAFVYHFGFNDTRKFLDNRKAVLKSKNQYFPFQKYLDEVTKQYGIDLEVEFLDQISQEACIFITESQTEDFSNNRYIALHLKDEKAKESLINIALKTNPEQDSSSFNGHLIKRIGLTDMFPKLFGKPFFAIQSPYFCIVEEYAVFAASENALKNYLSEIGNNKVLSNDQNFEAFFDNLSGSSNIFIYNNIARSVNLYKTISKEENLPVFEEKLATFRKFEAIAFQMTTEKKNLYYNSIYLKYNPVYKQETASLWELALDTFTSNAPQIVTNHTNGAKEIIVQDNAHKLYLISNTGKVLWTKQLQEKVMSEFMQIDVYKNNKLQLLFNTKSKIYLIDRNGNNVEKYPVKLPADASSSVTPLDYDKSRNYRILIGCADKKVYNYDISGSLVKGWEYPEAQSPAKDPINHFAINGKDYIIIPLKNGQVKVVERSGKDRIKLENLLPTGNPVYMKTASTLAKSYLVTADTNATVVKLFLNDQKEALKVDNVPNGARFSVLDFNGDKLPDYVFYWQGNILISDSEKNKLFETEYQQNIKSAPLGFNMNEPAMGFVAGNKIYLINNGVLADGFPLAGSTNFHIADINKDNTYNLVVAHQNMVYTYNLK